MDLNATSSDGKELVVSNTQNVTGNTKFKQKVLEEEEYLSVLDKIVERDFYPELSRMKLESEYLNALESDDVEELRKIQLLLDRSNMGELPNAEIISVDPEAEDDSTNNKESIQIDKKLSLDKFLAKNTSEDNASFEKIMEATRAKHKEKHAWLFQQQMELHDRLDASKALPSSVEAQLLAIETKPNNLDTWKYEARNALMYTPDGVELTAEEILNQKGKKEKQICHENTRFKEDPFNSNISRQAMLKASEEQANMKKAVGKVGVDGKLENGTINGLDESANVRGYNFVGAPSPVPGVEATPLMTWGAIEGTPLRLDATPAPSFKIAEPRRREQLAHSLVEKASKQHREKRKKAQAKAAHASFLSPRNSPSILASERLNRLTPAAQKLIKSSVRISTGDTSLRASYSSPSPYIGGRATPKTPLGRLKTPSSRVKTPGSSRGNAEGSSITDDLLNLPNI